MLDRARHRVPVEGQQPLLRRERRDQPGIGELRRRVAAHVVLEVGGHLEELGEVRIELVEQVVEQPVAQEDDLDVERDRLGLERDRADQTQALAERLDAQLARIERALQALPRERLQEDLACIEQQVAAVRAVQRAALDQRKIGEQRAHLRDVLDAPEQIVKGGWSSCTTGAPLSPLRSTRTFTR